MEWKLFSESSPEFASKEWYIKREAAHHLEESGGHRERLLEAEDLVRFAKANLGVSTASDLGCGDGGLLQLLTPALYKVWGYDLCPENVDYAVKTRGMDARYKDFVNQLVDYGDVTIVTEVLEHLEDPHDFLARLNSRVVVASSPYTETDLSHYAFHLWAWDNEGFKNLFENSGWKIIKHYNKGISQFVLAERI